MCTRFRIESFSLSFILVYHVPNTYPIYGSLLPDIIRPSLWRLSSAAGIRVGHHSRIYPWLKIAILLDEFIQRKKLANSESDSRNEVTVKNNTFLAHFTQHSQKIVKKSHSKRFKFSRKVWKALNFLGNQSYIFLKPIIFLKIKISILIKFEIGRQKIYKSLIIKEHLTKYKIAGISEKPKVPAEC